MIQQLDFYYAIMFWFLDWRVRWEFRWYDNCCPYDLHAKITLLLLQLMAENPFSLG